MALEREDLEKLKEGTLRRLRLEPVEFADETFQVVATFIGPREEPFEDPMRESIATHLGANANKAIEEEKAQGRKPAGFVSAKTKVDYSDNTEYEGPEGQRVSTSETGERCYRIVLLVANEA
jgi:hypothetical protein